MKKVVQTLTKANTSLTSFPLYTNVGPLVYSHKKLLVGPIVTWTIIFIPHFSLVGPIFFVMSSKNKKIKKISSTLVVNKI